MGKWGTGKIIKICEFCKKEFHSRVDRIGKYCSKSCGSSGKPKRFLRVKKNCDVCLKEYEIKLHRKDISKYCSHECRRKMMPKKENHPRWKGGVSRTWGSRKMIKKMKRVIGKCEICEVKENLQGHHVIRYSECNDLREEEKNIQILCIKCHAKQHPEIGNFILRGLVHEQKQMD